MLIPSCLSRAQLLPKNGESAFRSLWGSATFAKVSGPAASPRAFATDRYTQTKKDAALTNATGRAALTPGECRARTSPPI